MPITSLPTKTEASLGDPKSDHPSVPYVDPTTQTNAAQLEAMKTTMIEAHTELGLTDGSTPDSVNRAIRGLGAPNIAAQVALRGEQTGLTERIIGSVYLRAGTLSTETRALFGVVAGGGQALLRLRRNTGAALIATFTQPGAPGSVALGGPTAIPADDWYDISVHSDDGSTDVLATGLYLAWV